MSTAAATSPAVATALVATQATALASSTMQAVVQRSYGDADVLQSGICPRPKPAAGEVLLQVHAAGLDRGTWHLMTGKPWLMRLVMGFSAPKNPVPGFDVAGVVVEVGDGVTAFSVGDEVFGIGKGSFAEYACARADKLAKKPAAIGFDQAAVLSISGLTALQVVDAGAVRAGQTVLVLGAAGGVGSFVVPLAVGRGAVVTGVGSAAKAEFIRGLGAADVVDYTAADFTAFFDGARRFDVIIDIAGSLPVAQLRRALKDDGVLVFVGGEEGGSLTGGMNRQIGALLMAPLRRPQRFVMKVPNENGADLARLGALVDAGLRPSIDARFPLARAADAMRHLVSGRARGKIVIEVR